MVTPSELKLMNSSFFCLPFHFFLSQTGAVYAIRGGDPLSDLERNGQVYVPENATCIVTGANAGLGMSVPQPMLGIIFMGPNSGIGPQRQ